MPIFIYVCESCGNKKQHFFSTVSNRQVFCAKCGEKEKYIRQLGKATLRVERSTLEEKIAEDIDPWVKATYDKIGKEMISGDVKTLENVFGEEQVKSTFYEDDSWVDEDGID